MCEEWLNDKEAFYSWCLSNGYHKDLDLDKDIGSRELGIEPPIYSPETCRFIDGSTNAKATRKIISTNKTGYRGVSWSDSSNQYQAVIMNDNKYEYIKGSRYSIVCAIAYDQWIDDHKTEHTKNNIAESAIKAYHMLINTKKELKHNQNLLRKEKIRINRIIKESKKITDELQNKIDKNKDNIKYCEDRI